MHELPRRHERVYIADTAWPRHDGLALPREPRMNSTPESDKPVAPADAEPDDLQRVINQGRLPGLPSADDLAEEAAEEESRRARKVPSQISDLGDNADDLIGFNQRID